MSLCGNQKYMVKKNEANLTKSTGMTTAKLSGRDLTVRQERVQHEIDIVLKPWLLLGRAIPSAVSCFIPCSSPHSLFKQNLMNNMMNERDSFFPHDAFGLLWIASESSTRIIIKTWNCCLLKSLFKKKRYSTYLHRTYSLLLTKDDIWGWGKFSPIHHHKIVVNIGMLRMPVNW